VLIGAVYAVPLPARPPTGPVTVEYRDGQPAHIFLTGDEKWRLPVELDRVDPKLVAALIALEDKRFYSHAGVDPDRGRARGVDRPDRTPAGSRAARRSRCSWRACSSRASRTFGSKLVEMFRAMQLDARLSKREILEQYLSRTPYGRNLEASNRRVVVLRARRAAPVAARDRDAARGPARPGRYSPTKQNAERLRERRDAILGS
jgi:penicillin-binding protein 1C